MQPVETDEISRVVITSHATQNASLKLAHCCAKYVDMSLEGGAKWMSNPKRSLLFPRCHDISPGIIERQ